MIRRPGTRGVAAGPSHSRSSSLGQATVEVALVLPVVVVIALALVQVGVVVHARVRVTHAAREGVRVAAVGGTDEAVAQAAVVAGGLRPSRVQVTVERSGGRVHVRVDYAAATDAPLVGVFLDAVPLTASATMRLE